MCYLIIGHRETFCCLQVPFANSNNGKNNYQQQLMVWMSTQLKNSSSSKCLNSVYDDLSFPNKVLAVCWAQAQLFIQNSLNFYLLIKGDIFESYDYYLQPIFKIMNQEEIPLNDQFIENPLEYMQNYVKNLNNQIFLSQYHLNNLYALLLIGRNSPWDDVKSTPQTLKDQIEVLAHKKVHDVKIVLESLSNVYEDKVKKSTINQIQKLMSILKCKRKAIYIQKDKRTVNIDKIKKIYETKQNKIESQSQTSNYESQNIDAQEPKQQMVGERNINDNHNQRQKSIEQNEQQQHKKMKQEQIIEQEIKVPSNQSDQKQVFGIFYGLANLSNLSTLALSNILEYNSSERYIKFKMSQNYIMTIQNNDPVFFDRESKLSRVPSDMFINHLFPFLTAAELFGVRSVCKEWLDHVKQTWHTTFKRQMFVQLLACEFCKDIEFYYKTIQLRNPFFQKLSLLIHALIEIIQWQNLTEIISNNSLSLQLKRVILIILKFLGQPIEITNLASLSEQLFNQYKDKALDLKSRLSVFFHNLSGTILSINQLRMIKFAILDHPQMRVEEVNSEDKTPLLLTIFLKQMTLQQILRNHIFLSQEYLLNTKKRLDNISQKMVYQRGYLQGIYKILLFKSANAESAMIADPSPDEVPNFQQMLQSIFTNSGSNKPDFVLKNKYSSTEIFLDNATKLDIILSTIQKITPSSTHVRCCDHETNQNTQHEHKECKQPNNQIQQQNISEKNEVKPQEISNVLSIKIQNGETKSDCVNQSQKDNGQFQS